MRFAASRPLRNPRAPATSPAMNTHEANIAPGAVTVCGAPEGWDAKLLASLLGSEPLPVKLALVTR